MREDSRPRLLVADSFRVRVRPGTGAAEVRGWELHLERFAESVARVVPDERAVDLDAFLADAALRIAEYGEGFPRLELRCERDRDPEPHLSLRPLPGLGRTLELRTAGAVPLVSPEIKGPNISRLMELNRELGAEALLLDASGRAVEGATTSLIWWDRATGRGFRVAGPAALDTSELERSGHGTSEHRRDRVDSVTERLVETAAEEFGAPLDEARLSPAELAQHEVWAVNALHGIRPVTAIDGMPTAELDAARLRRFGEALDLTWEPVVAP